MECVWHAFRHHLSDFGLATDDSDRNLYNQLKRSTHGWRPQYTKGEATPYIIRRLAERHGLETHVQHRLWTPEGYWQQAYKNHDWRVMKALAEGGFGQDVEAFTWSPAIFCAISPIQHAFYGSLEQAKAFVCVLSIRLGRTPDYKEKSS